MVRLSTTEPLVIEGVYVDVKDVLFEKVPLGALHVALVAPPPILPDKIILPPSQIVCVAPAFTVADGLTVIVNVFGDPGQLATGTPPVKVGVTVTVEVMGAPVLLIVVNVGIFPVPLPASPIVVLLFVQA